MLGVTFRLTENRCRTINSVNGPILVYYSITDQYSNDPVQEIKEFLVRITPCQTCTVQGQGIFVGDARVFCAQVANLLDTRFTLP